MAINSKFLKVMAAAGCSAEQLIEIIEEDRRKERDRKRRLRARPKMSQGHRGTSRDIADKPQIVEPPAAAQTTNGASSEGLSVEQESTPSLSPSLPFSDLDLGKKEQVVVARARARGGGRKAAMVPLPDNWHPMEHLSPADVLELENFKDHARAKGRLCADWFAAWRNWKRKVPLFNGGSHGNKTRNGGGQGSWEPPRGSREDLRRRNALATDDLNAYAFDGADEPEGGSEISGEAPGWLSQSRGS